MSRRALWERTHKLKKSLGHRPGVPGTPGGPGEKRHLSINFLLWLTSRWPWDKRLAVPGLTGSKSLCVRLEIQENINFSRWLTGGLSQSCSDFQKVYVFKFYVLFLALGRTNRGLPPVSQGFPVIYFRKTDRKGHFCWDTGRVSRGYPAVRGFSEISCEFLLCALSAPIISVPWSLRPRNRAAPATCGRGCCELPAVLNSNPKNR